MSISFLTKVIDLFLPRMCPICGHRLLGEEAGICLACNCSLPRTHYFENPYENEMAKMFWIRIPIERAAAWFFYRGHSAQSHLIYRLKYFHQIEIGAQVGRLMAQEGKEYGFFDGIDAIVPIPLTRKRRRKRGYNQSEEIAKGIQEITQLPIITDAVLRTIFTESQTRKGRWGRADNVAHVFQLAKAYMPGQPKNQAIVGKHLLIIDDVCTTGATIIACTQELLKAGKMKFSILSIGHAKGS